jgi:uncharacterized protein (DUF486 family)
VLVDSNISAAFYYWLHMAYFNIDLIQGIVPSNGIKKVVGFFAVVSQRLGRGLEIAMTLR